MSEEPNQLLNFTLLSAKKLVCPESVQKITARTSNTTHTPNNTHTPSITQTPNTTRTPPTAQIPTAANNPPFCDNPRIGEVRIPTLAPIAGKLYAFFDVRPQPAGELAGDAFTGKTLASDLPNPNQIYFCEIDTSNKADKISHWSAREEDYPAADQIAKASAPTGKTSAPTENQPGTENTYRNTEKEHCSVENARQTANHNRQNTENKISDSRSTSMIIPTAQTALFSPTTQTIQTAQTHPTACAAQFTPDSPPAPLHTLHPKMPKISSDAAVAVNPENGEIHIAFSTIPAHSKIGYFDSAYAGERLIPALLFGKNLHALDYRELTELYEILKDPGGKPLCPDAIFATSGSSIIWNGMALFPYVVRKANETFIYVVHLQDGAISAVSEPIYADNANLDETALAVFDGKIYLNSRVQGFVGVGAGIRYLAESSDGIHFSQPIPWYLADPGCNAKQIGNLFIHPHSISARENGAIIAVPTLNSLSVDSLSQTSLSVDSISVNSLSSTSLPPKTVHESPKILGQFPAGSFGYSDAAYFAGKLYVLYESNSGLCLAVFEQVDEQKTS